MALSATRIAAIRSSEPSIHALNRAYDDGARNLTEAREWVWARRIETAERHDRGEHYGANNYNRRILREMPGATAHEAQAKRRAQQNRDMLDQIKVDRAVAMQPHAFGEAA